MTTMTQDPNEVLAPGFTMLDAAQAAFAQIAEDHGFYRDVNALSDTNAFHELMDRCPFLPDAIRDGITAEPHTDPEQQGQNIVTWLKADLYAEELASLKTNICFMFNQKQTRQGQQFIEGTLENIRAAVDGIEQSEDHTERNHVNDQVNEVISKASATFREASRLLTLMHINAAKLENSADPLEYSTANQSRQGAILADLEKLALLLGQDQWATAHGFEQPPAD